MSRCAYCSAEQDVFMRLASKTWCGACEQGRQVQQTYTSCQCDPRNAHRGHCPGTSGSGAAAAASRSASASASGPLPGAYVVPPAERRAPPAPSNATQPAANAADEEEGSEFVAGPGRPSRYGAAPDRTSTTSKRYTMRLTYDAFVNDLSVVHACNIEEELDQTDIYAVLMWDRERKAAVAAKNKEKMKELDANKPECKARGHAKLKGKPPKEKRKQRPDPAAAEAAAGEDADAAEAAEEDAAAARRLRKRDDGRRARRLEKYTLAEHPNPDGEGHVLVMQETKVPAKRAKNKSGGDAATAPKDVRILPRNAQEVFEIISDYHNVAHEAAGTVKYKISRSYDILDKYIDTFCARCPYCLTTKKSEMAAKRAGLKPIIAKSAWSRVFIDLKDFSKMPMPYLAPKHPKRPQDADNLAYTGEDVEWVEDPERQYRYVLHDHFSRFSILRPLEWKSAFCVAQELVEIFRIMGVPQVLHHDNGSEFVNTASVLEAQREE